jgi:hypothetical protein
MEQVSLLGEDLDELCPPWHLNAGTSLSGAWQATFSAVYELEHALAVVGTELESWAEKNRRRLGTNTNKAVAGPKFTETAWQSGGANISCGDP